MAVDLHYWNSSLYNILPDRIRNSVLELAIARYLIEDDEDAKEVVKGSEGSAAHGSIVADSASLRLLRKQLKGGSIPGYADIVQKVIEDMNIPSTDFEDELPGYTTIDSSTFSLMDYADSNPGRCVSRRYDFPWLIHRLKSSQELEVLVEWYQIFPSKWDPSPENVARERIACLSFLLQKNKRLTTLHTLDALGYVEDSLGAYIGLVSTLPNFASTILKPVTLRDLLEEATNPRVRAKNSQQTEVPLPKLRQRYELAASLASTLYTFMLVDWYHKRFNSSSIMFFYPKDATGSHAIPNFNQPFVGGFTVSRPASHVNLSSNFKTGEEFYLHPDLGSSWIPNGP